MDSPLATLVSIATINTSSQVATFSISTSRAGSTKPIYWPTFSPEHGVLLVLAGALLTGASLAQTWTWETSLACLGAFLGLQAPLPFRP